MEEYGRHYSVLHRECIDYLTENFSFDNEEYYADLTFGAGGHSQLLLNFHKNIKVFAVDQDIDAINNGNNLIEKNNLENRLFLNKMNFEKFPKFFMENHKLVLSDQGGLSGIIMDLGISSHQIDTKQRGMSFKDDAFLDMRMDREDMDITARDILNTHSEEEIADIIYNYGEEHYSRRISKAIVETRKHRPIETTKELENIIFHIYPKKERYGRIHPATKTFQALRIFVNRELEVLENTLEKLFLLLKPKGRLLVISFHSLEDRIVKNIFKRIRDSEEMMVNLITKKPIIPSDDEVKENPRSRSAKLRIIERCR